MKNEEAKDNSRHIPPEEYDSFMTVEGVTLSDGTLVPAGTPLTTLFPDGIWVRVRGTEVEIVNDKRRD